MGLLERGSQWENQAGWWWGSSQTDYPCRPGAGLDMGRQAYCRSLPFCPLKHSVPRTLSSLHCGLGAWASSSPGCRGRVVRDTCFPSSTGRREATTESCTWAQHSLGTHGTPSTQGRLWVPAQGQKMAGKWPLKLPLPAQLYKWDETGRRIKTVYRIKLCVVETPTNV